MYDVRPAERGTAARRALLGHVLTTAVLAKAAATGLEVVANFVDFLDGLRCDITHVLATAVLTKAAATSQVVVAGLVELLARLGRVTGGATTGRGSATSTSTSASTTSSASAASSTTSSSTLLLLSLFRGDVLATALLAKVATATLEVAAHLVRNVTASLAVETGVRGSVLEAATVLEVALAVIPEVEALAIGRGDGFALRMLVFAFAPEAALALVSEPPAYFNFSFPRHDCP